MANATSSGVPPQEMETFLSPEDKRKGKIVKSRHSSGSGTGAGPAEFDPFLERKLQNSTSNNDTLTHLLKASLGTGILAMPKAFKCAGLVNGVIFTVLVAVICTHCSYVLIKCAHVLYKRTRKCAMTFAEVGETALRFGPRALRPWANAFRIFILVSLFFTYFGTCSVYTVLIAKNIVQVAAYHMQIKEEDVEIRIFIICLLLPLIFMAWVRNLKYLAPVSMVANVFMALGLGITMYYIINNLQTENMNNMLFKKPSEWPEFFSLSIFAMEAIGVVMPLENAMKTPRSMLGICGVLNKGMSGVTLVYIVLGFLGYLCYGEYVKDSITLNLPESEPLAQTVKISIAIAVFCTFGLQFYVCIEIAWNTMKNQFTTRPDLANYILRTILVTICVLLAIAVPTIAPFMGVIGAFCFSILGLIAPAFIEIVTFWELGFGRTNYIIWKNVIVVIFGLFALTFGTREAVISIIHEYTKCPTVVEVCNSTIGIANATLANSTIGIVNATLGNSTGNVV